MRGESIGEIGHQKLTECILAVYFMIGWLWLAMVERQRFKSVNQLPGAVPNTIIKESAGALSGISLETYYEPTQTLLNLSTLTNPTKLAVFQPIKLPREV